SKLSRVIPALLTTISGAAPSPANSASTDESLPTSSTAPRLPDDRAERQLVIATAPCSLVAVPTTIAPWPANASAIARPMPRDAPVTSAVRPAMPGNFGIDEELIQPRRIEKARNYTRERRRAICAAASASNPPTTPYKCAATTTGPPTDSAVNGT